MLEQQNYRSNRDFGRKCRQEPRVDVGSTDGLETPRHGPEDLDRIRAFCAPAMTRIQPGGKSEDNNNECATECRDEEKDGSWVIAVRRGGTQDVRDIANLGGGNGVTGSHRSFELRTKQRDQRDRRQHPFVSFRVP